MELAWIEDFIALDRTRNFTAAAQMRHTTQPAYSRRIQNLEYWLGVSLFNRDARPVMLTKAGEDFKPRAYRLREDMMDARRIVNLAATSLPDAKIIYTTNSIAIGILPQWIQSQGLKNYRLVVSSVTTCVEAIQQKRCDYALIPHFPSLDHDIEPTSTIMTQDRMVFIMPDLLDVRIDGGYIDGATLAYSPKTAFGQAIDHFMQQNKIHFNHSPICESASAEALLAQLKNAMGAGWVIESLLDPSHYYGRHHKQFDIPFNILLLES